MTDTTLPHVDEVVTHARVQDLQLPGGAGTFALITLDNGFDHTKPNSFGPGGLAELGAVLDTLSTRASAGEIVGVGITGKPFIFAVGAYITGVPAVTNREQALQIARAGHDTFQKLADLPVPTFAFINGASMGGGVEVGLYADYRTISSDVPAYAFPECFLGLVPGWGGTYLVPHLVGTENAAKIIVSNPLSQNRMIKGKQAFELGLADRLLEPVTFLEDSLAFAGRVIGGQEKVERAAVDAVRPGVTAEQVDAAARDVLADEGLADALVHRTGHGIGLSVHEEPYIVAGNALPLQEGMAFSVEPGIYFPGQWGARIEDIVIVTDDGCEPVNVRPHELLVL